MIHGTIASPVSAQIRTTAATSATSSVKVGRPTSRVAPR